MKNAVSLLIAALLLLITVSANVNAAQNTLAIEAVRNGIPAYLRPLPDYVDARVLAANTNEDHTIPTGARWVIFSSSCAAFYAKKGGTAAVPGADVTDGSGSSLNPAGYYVERSTTIGLISPTTCVITMEFFL